MLVMEFFGLRVFAKLLRVPKHILLPIVFVLCAVGAFGLNNRVFDVWVALGFGVLGYVLTKLKFPTSPMILGIILGPMAETGFRRGAQLYSGDFSQFLTRPIADIFLVAAIGMIVFIVWEHEEQEEGEAAKA